MILARRDETTNIITNIESNATDLGVTEILYLQPSTMNAAVIIGGQVEIVQINITK